MTTEEKAREFAINALKEDLDKLAKAYLEGYNAGKSENKANPINIDGVEFYDMGLPSGTLWSSTILDNKGEAIRATYKEVMDADIPTPEEVKELKSYVKCEYTNSRHIFTNVYGKKFTLGCFWVKRDLEDNVYGSFSNGCLVFNRSFVGDKLSVVLVKRPNK